MPRRRRTKRLVGLEAACLATTHRQVGRRGQRCRVEAALRQILHHLHFLCLAERCRLLGHDTCMHGLVEGTGRHELEPGEMGRFVDTAEMAASAVLGEDRGAWQRVPVAEFRAARLELVRGREPTLLWPRFRRSGHGKYEEQGSRSTRGERGQRADWINARMHDETSLPSHGPAQKLYCNSTP